MRKVTFLGELKLQPAEFPDPSPGRTTSSSR